VFLSIWLGALTGVVMIGGGILIFRRVKYAADRKYSTLFTGLSHEELVKQAEEIKKALSDLKTLMEQITPPPAEVREEPKTESPTGPS
jgi:hypothetical protein